jgi:hypothetical protein
MSILSRYFLFTLAVAVLAALFCCNVAVAQQAGVLLGFGQLTPDGGSGYQTMWIVFTGEQAKVAVIVPNVIVPRATGFWRVGRTLVCEFDESISRDSNREVLWFSPIEKTPAPKVAPPCKNHLAGDEADGDNPSEPESSDNVVLCGKETAGLLFVSPAIISQQFDSWDGCDARGGRDQSRDEARRFEDPTPLSMSEFFGERASAAYSKAVDQGFAINSKEVNCPTPDSDEYDLKSWQVVHVRGAWHAAAAMDSIMGECAFPYPTELVLPKSVSGEISKAALWPALAKAIPHLSDFYFSPLGDYALVLVSPKTFEYHLYAYSAKNGALDKRLAEIPWENTNSHPIVMAQWSAGKYVPQWTAVLQKIKDHPLPDPVLPAPTYQPPPPPSE